MRTLIPTTEEANEMYDYLGDIDNLTEGKYP